MATTAAPEEKLRPTAGMRAVRRPRPAAIAAALALGALGLGVLANRGAIEAYLEGGETIGPDTTWTAQQKAWAIRADAITACDARRWVACTQKLDEAMQLDPAGESDPRVVAARREVAEGMPVPWPTASLRPSTGDPAPKPRLE
jgi:hypothetical protein